jgi:hypothetical protein
VDVMSRGSWCRCSGRILDRQPTGQSPLNHRDYFCGPALRHGSLNSLLRVALYLPSSVQVYNTLTVTLNVDCDLSVGTHLALSGLTGVHRPTFPTATSQPETLNHKP